MKNKYRKLKEVTEGWQYGNGIFNYLNALSVPWSSTDIPAEQLNLLYYGTYSGEKVIAPLLDVYVENKDYISISEYEKLAQSIYVLYNPYWIKQYNTLSLEYNPIENYSMKETENLDHTVTYGEQILKDNNLSSTNIATNIDTNNLHTEMVSGITVTTNANIAGFNSTGYANDNQTVATPSGKDTTANTGTVNHSINGTITNTGTITDTHSGSDNTVDVKELKRSGNIGVTTSQQMLQSERDLWIWNFFTNIVFPNIDKVLTCPIY